MKDGLKSTDYRVEDLEMDEMNLDFTNEKGIYIDNITAEVVISGGMWVIGSAASGTSMNPVAKTGSFGQGTPFGVCLSTTASGSNPTILVRGAYKGLVAEADINAGDVIIPGVGGGMNCVTTAGSDTAQFDAGDIRGLCIMGGGSEATVGVYLW